DWMPEMSLEPPPVKVVGSLPPTVSYSKLPDCAPLLVGWPLLATPLEKSPEPAGGEGEPASLKTWSQSCEAVVEGPPPPEVRSPVLALASISKRFNGTGLPLPWPTVIPKMSRGTTALTMIEMVVPPGRLALLAPVWPPVTKLPLASTEGVPSNPLFAVTVQ